MVLKRTKGLLTVKEKFTNLDYLKIRNFVHLSFILGV